MSLVLLTLQSREAFINFLSSPTQTQQHSKRVRQKAHTPKRNELVVSKALLCTSTPALEPVFKGPAFWETEMMTSFPPPIFKQQVTSLPKQCICPPRLQLWDVWLCFCPPASFNYSLSNPAQLPPLTFLCC